MVMNRMDRARWVTAPDGRGPRRLLLTVLVTLVAATCGLDESDQDGEQGARLTTSSAGELAAVAASLENLGQWIDLES